MPLLERAKTFAGISVDSIGLRYMELSGTLGKLSCRYALIPVFPPPVCQDLLVDATGLLPAIAALKKEIGGFSAPVSLGLPSRDCCMRAIELPPMKLEEARAAMAFELEGHFRFSASEATYDMAPVELPGSEGRSVFLVAASRRKTVEVLMDLASKGDLPLQALEPANLAAFRAVLGPAESKGGFMALILERETAQLMVAYNDNGIFFRTLPFSFKNFPLLEGVSALAKEVASTVTGMERMFKELKVKALVLYGASNEAACAIQEGVKLPVALLPDAWEAWGISPPKGLTKSGWEVAIGLAARDLL